MNSPTLASARRLVVLGLTALALAGCPDGAIPADVNRVDGAGDAPSDRPGIDRIEPPPNVCGDGRTGGAERCDGRRSPSS